MSPVLTIAIPTFNRPRPLIETLTQLASQADIDHCRVVVLDNCSDTDMAEVIRREFKADMRVDVVRNVANLGLGGNILRCIENATTDWLWILADDDDLEINAIGAILQRIRNEPDADFFMFALNGHHRAAPATSGITDFATNLDDWGRITFISAGVYRTQSAVNLLGIGINYAYTVIPFVAMIIQGVQAQGWKVGFDDTILVNAAHKAESTWSWIWSINTYICIELVEDSNARVRLGLLASKWCLGPVGLAHDYAKRRLENRSGLTPFAYEHKRMLISWGGWRQRLLLALTTWAAIAPPAITLGIIEALRRLAGRHERNKRGGEAVFGQV